jgi:tight adherence protein B
MTNWSLLWLLLVFSCLSLAGLGISGVLVVKAQKEKEKRNARLESIGQSGGRVRQIYVSAFTRPEQAGSRSFATICISVLGFDRERAETYPANAWIIIPVTLVLAKVTQSLSTSLVGDISYLGLPVIWVFFSRYAFKWIDRRRKHRLVIQLPDMLDQITRAVRVGTPVLEAIRAAAREGKDPTRPEFIRLVDQVSVGTALEDAAAEMARRCAVPEYNFFATALALQNQTGGTLSETLITLADEVRKRVAAAEKGKAMSSEAKATAVVLTLLPFITGLALWSMNPAYMSVLFNDPQGHKLLGAAGVSLLLGLVAIRMMFRRALSLT